MEQNKFKMPLPESSNAPKFEHDKPQEVLRFIARMTSLFKQAGIDDVKVRKERILEYVDTKVEKEWRAFTTFEEGTWDAFLKEIEASYPEADKAGGRLERLTKICKEHAQLGKADSAEIHSLIRKFRAEAVQLKGVIGNGILVERFLECLNPSFEGIVQDRLLQKYGHYRDDARQRHPDDQYDLAEVITVISALVDESPRKGNPNADARSRGIKREDSDTAETVAHLQDRMNTMNKEMSNMRSYVHSMENELKGTKGVYKLDPSAPTLHSSSQYSPPGSRGCFHCWLTGHMIADCPHLQQQIKEGALILIGGRPRLPSGQPIPTTPHNISPRERVAQILINSVSAFYGWTVNGEEKPEITYSIYTNSARDTRDDLLERVNHSESEKKTETDRKVDKLCELVAGLIATRSTANPDEVARHNEKDF
ncbi:hypothetical protein H0H93_002591 [Arthromyces matolae]|nr:hypothetical protein H0H93_002591 [Arthromyces matolae]